MLLDLTVVGVSGEGDGAGDPGEVPVTRIVLFSGRFQEVSIPVVIFREDCLETWLFKDFDVESEAKEMTT